MRAKKEEICEEPLMDVKEEILNVDDSDAEDLTLDQVRDKMLVLQQEIAALESQVETKEEVGEPAAAASSSAKDCVP